MKDEGRRLKAEGATRPTHHTTQREMTRTLDLKQVMWLMMYQWSLEKGHQHGRWRDGGKKREFEIEGFPPPFAKA